MKIMVIPAEDQVPDGAKTREFDVLLAEYKSHHDEIFRWLTYRHQAVYAFLFVLSALATVVASIAGKPEALSNLEGNFKVHYLLIAVMYVSIAVIYILFQFQFMVGANVKYIYGYLLPRLRETTNSSAILEWERINTKFRADSPWPISWLVKVGIELIPQSTLILSWIWYVIEFAKDDHGRLSSGIFTSGCSVFAWLVFVVIMPLLLLVILVIGQKRLADRYKLSVNQPSNVPNA